MEDPQQIYLILFQLNKQTEFFKADILEIFSSETSVQIIF
jgi:hypothetical protein